MEEKGNYDDGIEEERPILDPIADADYQEEAGAEIAPSDVNDFEDDKRKDADLTNVYGWVAIALSVLSFFIIPVLFAAAGIVVGFIARHKSAPILGGTAITIGIISLITRFLILPMI